MATLIDRTGETYGRLKALSYLPDYKKRGAWICVCECGSFVATRGENLKSGRTKSCGCLQRDLMSKRMFKHGRSINTHPDFQRYNHDNQFKRKYGIGIDERDAMLTEQNGKCKICNEDFYAEAGTPHIDHCHSTGKIRGLLCKACNTGIGQMKDRIDLLTNAIKYLQEN